MATSQQGTPIAQSAVGSRAEPFAAGSLAAQPTSPSASPDRQSSCRAMETWSFPLLVLVAACLECSWSPSPFLCVALSGLWPREWEPRGVPGLNPLAFLCAGPDAVPGDASNPRAEKWPTSVCAQRVVVGKELGGFGFE